MSQVQQESSTCSCGNPACAVRAARGLMPFCRIPASAPQKPAGYSSREACRAAHPGQRVYGRAIGGMGHGWRWYPLVEGGRP